MRADWDCFRACRRSGEIRDEASMNANVGGRLFAGSLLVAGLSAFSVPMPYRWLPIGCLGLAGAVFALANWACVAIWLGRGKAPSMFPLVGNFLLILTALAVPICSFRRWALAGLIIDPWLITTLVGAGTLLLRGRVNRGAEPDPRSE